MTDMTGVEAKLDGIAASLNTIEGALQVSAGSLGDIEVALETLASNSSVTLPGWSDVETLMEGVTVVSGTPVTGEVLDLGEIKENFLAIVHVEFPVNTFYSASLQGSFDGVYWWGLAGVANATASQSASGDFTMQAVEGKPSRYLRAVASSPAGTFTVIAVKAASR